MCLREGERAGKGDTLVTGEEAKLFSALLISFSLMGPVNVSLTHGSFLGDDECNATCTCVCVSVRVCVCIIHVGRCLPGFATILLSACMCF